MDYTEVGLAILDIYDNDSLLKCVSSLPKLEISGYVIGNRKFPVSGFVYDKNITHSVGMATLRNHALAHFRNHGIKYIFLLTSNVLIKDPNFIERTIKTAETFGTWVLTGNVQGSTILDDDSGQSLHVNTKVEPNFMFLRSGVVASMGYFDEQFVNTSYLDVLDYVERARKLGIYPPSNFFATVGDVYDITDAKIDRVDHSDTLDKNNRSVGLSFGYFQHLHKYVPTIDDIKSISKDDLMVFMGDLQESYSVKI
jgi:hypothetical protein